MIRPSVPTRRRDKLSTALWATICITASPQVTASALVPLGDVARPTLAIHPSGQLRSDKKGCGAPFLKPMSTPLPFGTGERLAYEVMLMGVRAGTIAMEVGGPTVTDGVSAYALHATARTEAAFDALGTLSARMVSLFDAATLAPVRMANEIVMTHALHTEPAITREDGAFSPSAPHTETVRGSTVHARLERSGAQEKTRKNTQLTSPTDAVDLVSLLYFLRTRVLTDGTELCIDLYHRSRFWRVSGRVGGIEPVKTASGVRQARRIDATIERRKAGAPPRPITMWLSEDDRRIPLRLATPEGTGRIEVSLTSEDVAVPSTASAQSTPTSPVP